MIKIDFRKRYSELAMGCAVLLEILVLFYYNIFHLRDALDHDFAMVMRHVMEMADRHTLFLPYWNYMSQGEMDESSLIALPVYMLTKNIYLGYAIAGIINVLLWAWVVWRLLSIAGLDRRYRLLALGLIFTAYDFGMLEYTNMLFFGGAYYVYKVLTPLMLLIIMLTDWKGRYRIPDIIIAVLYHILLLFIGMASGTYVLLCGLAPVLICFIIPSVLGVDKGRRKQWLLFTVTSIAVSLIGLAIGIRGGIAAFTYTVRSLDDALDTLYSTVKDVLILLRALTPYEERVTSLRGIIGLIRLVIAGFILIFGLASVSGAFGTGTYRRVRDGGEDSLSDGGYKPQLIKDSLISIALWTFMILALTISQPRYHIMGVVPLMICAAMNFSDVMEKDRSTVFPQWFMTLIAAVLIYVCLYTGFIAETEYFHEQDANLHTIDDVTAMMREYDVNTVFNIDSTDMAPKLRVSYPSGVFETYITEDGSVNNHIFYYTEWDRSAFTDRNFIIAKEGEFDLCPDHIRDSYELLGESGEYTIYFSEKNPIDGMAGLPLDERSVDLVTAPGYEVSGLIDAEGYLHTSDKGEIVRSPVLNSPLDPVFTRSDPRRYRMLCNYEAVPGSSAVLTIYRDGEPVAECVMDPKDSSAVADFEGGPGEITYVIRKEDDTPVTIKEIEFEVLE